jgi:cytochrome P450
MERFVELPVSVFDPDFTLNPYGFLEDLYPRKDVLGFQSEGKNFLFRYYDCNAVLKSHDCRREPTSNAAYEALEARYAREYPNRTLLMSNNFNIGKEDLKTKVEVMRLIGALSEQASFDIAEPTFEKLDKDDENDDYVAEISSLPLKILLETAGVPVSDEEVKKLYNASCAFLQSFDNTQDEQLVARCEAAAIELLDYTNQRYPQFQPGTLMYDYVQACKKNGLSEDLIKGNIIGPLIISASNTMGISSAYLLRNLVRFPAIRRTLQARPEMLDEDNVIVEFLRRDNHVKALSRQAHADVAIGDYTLKAGETVYLFFPGANLDPSHWENPLELDFTRDLSPQNHIIFGGAKHVCIGKAMGVAFLRHMARGFLRYLPDDATINDADIEMDGAWITERIIQRMPIELGPT